MDISAAVMRRIGEFDIEEIELDPPQPGEVLVEIAACGLCGSDLHVIDGLIPEPMPLVLGHEAAGTVVALGQGVTHLTSGDHVVLSIVPSCGQCRACRSGRSNLCEVAGRMAATGTLADGTARLHLAGERLHHFNSVSSFASHAVVPASGAIRIDKDIDLELAALLSCAVTTGVGAVLNTAAVPAGATVAVIGCGGVGLSVVQGARIAGASCIIAIDTRPNSLELARTLGATDVLQAQGAASESKEEAFANLVQAVRDLTNGGVDFAFEAYGSPSTIEQAWAMTAVGGASVVVGLPPKGSVASLDPWGFICEKRVLGCFMGSADPARDIPRLVELADRGELRLDALATDRVGLRDLAKAVDATRSGRGIRYLVIPGDQD